MWPDTLRYLTFKLTLFVNDFGPWFFRALGFTCQALAVMLNAFAADTDAP